MISRRRFLGLAGAGLLAACHKNDRHATGEHEIPSATPKGPIPAPPAARTTLSADEWTLLAALTERILPSEDGPGAREAGVIDFIDRQLATPAVKPLAEAVHQFAASFAEWAKKHGTPFHELPVAEQDRALAALAEGKLDLDFTEQAELFEFVHSLTLEGFLSDPIYGGNRDQVGWRLIGFQPHPAGHVHGKGG